MKKTKTGSSNKTDSTSSNRKQVFCDLSFHFADKRSKKGFNNLIDTLKASASKDSYLKFSDVLFMDTKRNDVYWMLVTRKTPKYGNTCDICQKEDISTKKSVYISLCVWVKYEEAIAKVLTKWVNTLVDKFKDFDLTSYHGKILYKSNEGWKILREFRQLINEKD